jgi:hypothetical protein
MLKKKLQTTDHLLLPVQIVHNRQVCDASNTQMLVRIENQKIATKT